MGPLWSVILLDGPGQLWLLSLTILSRGWPPPSVQLDGTIRGCWGGPVSCLHSESSEQISKCHVEESRWWDLELLRLYRGKERWCNENFGTGPKMEWGSNFSPGKFGTGKKIMV